MNVPGESETWPLTSALLYTSEEPVRGITFKGIVH